MGLTNTVPHFEIYSEDPAKLADFYRLLTLMVGRLWNRLVRWPWRNSIQEGLAPVSIGLLLAGCFTFARGAVTGVDTAAITVGTLLILLKNV